MQSAKRVICVIPARLASVRFPRKMLAPLMGKPLLQWAYEGACRVSLFDKVVIAVDSQELYEVARSFGAEVYLTSPDCASGTDRLVELQKNQKLHGDIWVNWQGDEPFLTEKTIQTLLQSREGEIWTLKKKITKEEEICSPHVVKVVCDAKGKALYFSRSPIPSGKKNVYKHVGLYAFSHAALEKIGSLSPCELEEEERLEQLRFLFHAIGIQVHETEEEIFGIDTPKQLVIAEQLCYSFPYDGHARTIGTKS